MGSREEIQKKVVNSLSTPSHGILKLAPRVGKTKIGIDIIKKEKPEKILWVTVSTKLRDVDIPEEFKKWDAENYLSKTTIICWSSLNNITGFYHKIILDEFQQLTDANSQNLLHRRLCYSSILCLSGVFPRDASKRIILNKLKLGILFEITIDQAVEYGLIADYKINVLKVSLDKSRKNIKAGSKKKPFMTTEEDMYNYLTEVINSGTKAAKFMRLKRMHLIHNSETKQLAANNLINRLQGRKIIFSGSIEQSLKFSNNVYNSKSGDSFLTKFLNQEIDTLSCVKSGGTGFTYKNIDHCVIVQADSDNSGESTQKLCRALLLESDRVGNIWFIILKNTQDEVWLSSTLKSFNKDKITYEEYTHDANS